MKSISVTIEDEIYLKLQDLKKYHHTNISAFIASAVKEKLDKEKSLAK